MIGGHHHPRSNNPKHRGKSLNLKHDATSPEAALWIAVMQQAVNEAREWYPPRRGMARKWFRGGVGYVPVDDTDECLRGVGGIEWVCHAIGLNANSVMDAINKTSQEPTQPDWKRYQRLNKGDKARFDYLVGSKKKLPDCLDDDDDGDHIEDGSGWHEQMVTMDYGEGV